MEDIIVSEDYESSNSLDVESSLETSCYEQNTCGSVIPPTRHERHQ